MLVGRKPASADGEYDLQINLALPPEPPANDKFAAARRLPHLPATVAGTTVGARSEDSDPEGCDLAGATVWYRLRLGHDGLVLLKLHANGKLDAVVGVLERARSRLGGGSCRQTNGHGDATLAFRAVHTTTYFVLVGQQQGSKPGTFKLTALAAAPAERFPGKSLPSHTVRGTLERPDERERRLAHRPHRGNDDRFAFSSPGCARAELVRRTDHSVLVSMSCSGYRTFTPGPEGGGMYVLQVIAAPNDRAQPYRLQFAQTEADDVGIGLPLANLEVHRARLDPQGVDVVDIYHFDVQRLSNVQVGLEAPAGAAFRLQLVTESGGRVAAGQSSVRRELAPGRYVVAVTAAPATTGGAYRLTLLVRDLTSTTIAVPSGTLSVGSAVTLRPVVTPAATGVVELQIDRFDPLGGWQFTKLVRIPVGSSVTWIAPAAGTWRVRATYRGSTAASPSRSEYVTLTIR